MNGFLRTARLSTAVVGALAVTLATTGWLYLLRPLGQSPPRVGDALPLDELAKRSASSLIVFTAVWVAAALLLGLIARAAPSG